jgi:hypothetical protein
LAEGLIKEEAPAAAQEKVQEEDLP